MVGLPSPKDMTLGEAVAYIVEETGEDEGAVKRALQRAMAENSLIPPGRPACRRGNYPEMSVIPANDIRDYLSDINWGESIVTLYGGKNRYSPKVFEKVFLSRPRIYAWLKAAGVFRKTSRAATEAANGSKETAPIVDEPSPSYRSPCTALALEAEAHFGLSLSTEKAETIQKWIKGRAKAQGIPGVTDRLAKGITTMLRQPYKKKGGNSARPQKD